MKKILAVIMVCIVATPVFPLSFTKDENQKDAKYLLNVQKQDAKTKYQKKVYKRNPNGFMTVEEYEQLSAPKDLKVMDFDEPKTVLPSDKSYVPKPTYKIVRYNNPPGAVDLSIPHEVFKYRQFNAQGIVSPDYSKLVYPSIYYYPNSASIASDLFVINLNPEKPNMERIMTATVSQREPEPIISTDSDNSVHGAFRTLTPVDFSQDGTMLLAKKKIGNSNDGIWQTKIIVYDFTTKLTYDLQEVREAIVYHWKNNGLNLEEKRWDIYPLGFSAENPSQIIIKAFAYTGSKPVNLGIWSVDAHGEQSKLITENGQPPAIEANGLKLEQSGVVSHTIIKEERRQNKIIEKSNAKKAKAEEKKELKDLKIEYKKEIKQLDYEYKLNDREYRIRQKYTTSTGGFNEGLVKYKEERTKQFEAEIAKDEAKIKKQEEKIQALQEKINAIDESIKQYDEKSSL